MDSWSFLNACFWVGGGFSFLISTAISGLGPFLCSDSLERTFLTGGLSLSTGVSPSYGLVVCGGDLNAFGLVVLSERMLLGVGGFSSLIPTAISGLDLFFERMRLTGALSLDRNRASSDPVPSFSRIYLWVGFERLLA